MYGCEQPGAAPTSGTDSVLLAGPGHPGPIKTPSHLCLRERAPEGSQMDTIPEDMMLTVRSPRDLGCP